MEIALWKDKDSKVINPVLFSDVAEKLAKDIAGQGSRRINKGTQIRRFYDEVLRLSDRTKTNPDEWDNVIPYVNMLIAKAAYAHGRGLVSDGFVDFMRKGISQIEKKEDLTVFATFFEAFMGYYKSYGPQ